MIYSTAMRIIETMPEKGMRLPEWDADTSLVWSEYAKRFAVHSAKHNCSFLIKGPWHERIERAKNRADWEVVDI